MEELFREIEHEEDHTLADHSQKWGPFLYEELEGEGVVETLWPSMMKALTIFAMPSVSYLRYCWTP